MSARSKKLLVSSLLVGVAAIAAALGAQDLPEVPGDGEGGADRCSGTTQPICREVETCVGFGETRRCTTDYYYFPGNG